VLPALIILALWAALLAPGAVRWLRRRKPTTSIASFHRQLRLLEHTGPKLVEPAYRLEGEDDHVTEREVPPPPPRVPRLVLLPAAATPKEPTMRYDDRYDDAYEDPFRPADRQVDAAWDDPWAGEDELDPPTRSHRTVRAPRADDYEDAYDEGDDYDYDYDDGYGHGGRRRHAAPVPVLSPDRARARRTRILAGLGAAIVVSFVFGFLPSLGLLWIVTLLGVVALGAYLVLMLYASNQGLYGHDSLARVTPVARTVISPYESTRDDERWESDRVAAAR
jgi:hypothetical protein